MVYVGFARALQEGRIPRDDFHGDLRISSRFVAAVEVLSFDSLIFSFLYCDLNLGFAVDFPSFLFSNWWCSWLFLCIFCLSLSSVNYFKKIISFVLFSQSVCLLRFVLRCWFLGFFFTWLMKFLTASLHVVFYSFYGLYLFLKKQSLWFCFLGFNSLCFFVYSWFIFLLGFVQSSEKITSLIQVLNFILLALFFLVQVLHWEFI